MVDFDDNEREAEFRDAVREFVDEHHPEVLADENRYSPTLGGLPVGRLSEGERKEQMRPWHAALKERGWIAPAWPKEYGGADLSTMEQFILGEVFAEKRASAVSIRNDAASTIMLYGSEELKQKYLPGMLDIDESWTQGYSEPGSGSDLASLQTRATRDGDDFVLNGQKIWTSGADKAKMMFGLFRTDPEAPKHRGISYILVPMDTPGIKPNPIEQITGSRSFNEVFFEDARVPVGNVVGEINRGWYAAATTLDFERSQVGSAVGLYHLLSDLLKTLREEAEPGGYSRLGDPSRRAALADNHVEAEVARLFSYRVITMQNRGQVPNYEASIQKVFVSEVKQRMAKTAYGVLGLYAQLADKEDPRAPMRSKWQMFTISTIAETIGAGTSEIQRNVIATRGLGLPRG